uniref:Uncharacterized protein n=1 Tax=Tanacetum cinerariifolium TaxID=118510 RepID=A0A699H9E4_TANCI|nr:hypothetical protein [Tanacetum cinerariifolium]
MVLLSYLITSLRANEIANKENKDTVPRNERITDYIYNWITAKYGAPNGTWNDDQFDLVADDILKTFYDKLDSIPECSTKEANVSKCLTKEATVPECSMIEANVPECSTKKATKDVASHIAATNIVDPQTEVIEISLGTEELECTSTEELESSSTTELESSSTEDDSDDEEFSSSSAELVTCTLVLIKKSFSDEVEDDTEEEVEDETDKEAEDDTDDETWSPKTIILTSKNGETSSSSPSTKKTIVNRGEQVRHCILGLANPKTREMIRKKEFGFKKDEVKKQVNKSKEQVNKGKRKMND